MATADTPPSVIASRAARVQSVADNGRLWLIAAARRGTLDTCAAIRYRMFYSPYRMVAQKGTRAMRVLLTVQPSTGHLHPLVPVAAALASSGHDVMVCSSASLGPEFARFVVTMFADVTTGHMVPDLLELARRWRPDLIVRESMEYGGCIAADALGIPHASIAGNAYS